MTHICPDIGFCIGSVVVNSNMLYAYFLQHIEDLTQEKFSLQRALEASRALAESLAAENSTLTDSYNQQVYFHTSAFIQNCQKSKLSRLSIGKHMQA